MWIGIMLALAIGAVAPAAAQLREGGYAIAGVDPDGARYEGEAALRPGAGGTWLMVRQTGPVRLLGLGLIQSGILAVAFDAAGRIVVAAYAVDAAGRLVGSISAGGGIATETLTPR